MPSREYHVEAENILPEGFEPGAPLYADANDPGALGDLMLKAAAVLEMVGGTFSVVAIRNEIAPGLWVPERYAARWESYAPGRRAPKPEPEAEPILAHELPEEEDEDPGDTGDPAQNGEAPPVEEWGPDAEAALAETV
jgi:hypothetical protein